MSDNTAPDVSAKNFAGEAPVDPAARGGALEAVRTAEAAPPSDPEAVLEVELEALELPPPPATGFEAFLQNANLQNLMQIESLSRTTGVFQVLSLGRRGYLHMARGELIHAETGTLVGEAAALEIRSWNAGQLETSARPLSATTTIHTPLQALLLQLAQGQDEAVESVRRPPVVRSRVPDEDKPTEPHLPAPGVEAQPRPASVPPPRSSRQPPPLPPRIERDMANVTMVVLSASGELLQSRGQSPDELAARVAYAARLAELIGRAIRSGAPRGLELHGKGTHTSVKWQPDGGVSASLELLQSPKIR